MKIDTIDQNDSCPSTYRSTESTPKNSEKKKYKEIVQRQIESLTWRLASAIIIERKMTFSSQLKESRLVSEASKLTSHSFPS